MISCQAVAMFLYWWDKRTAQKNASAGSPTAAPLPETKRCCSSPMLRRLAGRLVGLAILPSQNSKRPPSEFVFLAAVLHTWQSSCRARAGNAEKRGVKKAASDGSVRRVQAEVFRGHALVSSGISTMSPPMNRRFARGPQHTTIPIWYPSCVGLNVGEASRAFFEKTTSIARPTRGGPSAARKNDPQTPTTPVLSQQFAMADCVAAIGSSFCEYQSDEESPSPGFKALASFEGPGPKFHGPGEFERPGEFGKFGNRDVSRCRGICVRTM